MVSLHDADARPIVKGRLGKPVEFGYKAQLVDNEDGVIVDHNVEPGNPPDARCSPQRSDGSNVAPAAPPRAVAADRGYGEHGVEDELRDDGVATSCYPPGASDHTATPDENRRAFRRHVRWRTGSEGRISCLQRDYALARTRLDGMAAPEPGAVTASSLTTSSRSAPSSRSSPTSRQHPADPRQRTSRPGDPTTECRPQPRVTPEFFRSK